VKEVGETRVNKTKIRRQEILQRARNRGANFRAKRRGGSEREKWQLKLVKVGASVGNEIVTQNIKEKCEKQEAQKLQRISETDG